MNSPSFPPCSRVSNCPLERKVAYALTAARLNFQTDFEGAVPEHLDFHIPLFDVFIEIKGGHSPRISNQMKRAPNVIVLQGERSVEFFCNLLQR